MTISPFDPRTVLFAKHAQHVVLIHFPIALFLVGVVFDVLAAWKQEPSLASVAFFNVILAAVAVIPTALTGVTAWQWELEGRRLHGILLLHLIFAAVASCLVLVCGYMHWMARRRDTTRRRSLRIALELLASAAIMAAAHLGGFVSGVNSTF